MCIRDSNKIVEDIHAPLRLASKGNNNDRLSAPTIQDVINHSNVMEPRNINHKVSVSKEEFCEEYSRTFARSHAANHSCQSHKLPQRCSRILRPGPKPWKSLTDDSILKAVASWNWLHAYFATYRAAGVGIGGSKMSKLMLGLTVVRQVSSQPVYASMCNFTYAAIGLRLHTFMVEGTLHY